MLDNVHSRWNVPCLPPLDSSIGRNSGIKVSDQTSEPCNKSEVHFVDSCRDLESMRLYMSFRTIFILLFTVCLAAEYCDVAAFGLPSYPHKCCCSTLHSSTCNCSDQHPHKRATGDCSLSGGGCSTTTTVMVVMAKEPALPIATRGCSGISLLTVFQTSYCQFTAKELFKSVFHPPNCC